MWSEMQRGVIIGIGIKRATLIIIFKWISLSTTILAKRSISDVLIRIFMKTAHLSNDR